MKDKWYKVSFYIKGNNPAQSLSKGKFPDNCVVDSLRCDLLQKPLHAMKDELKLAKKDVRKQKRTEEEVKIVANAVVEYNREAFKELERLDKAT